MRTTRSPSATGRRSRREEYSESTRSALVSAALELFARSGYAEASLDAIAAAARVTKGALYHHFPGGKKALFTSCFEQLEQDVHDRLAEHLAEVGGTPWESARAGLRMFLDICLEPAYRRVVWQEGPHVLGFGTWWDCEQRHALGLIISILETLMDSGDIERMPLEPLARTVSGALAGAATAIGLAEDPQRERAEFEQVIGRLLGGLRPAPAPVAG